MYTNHQQAVIDHLEEENATFQHFSDEGIIAIRVGGRNGSYATFVETYEDRDTLCIETHSAILVPKGARNLIGELSLKINKNLTLGRFDLDFESGRWGFHIGHIITDELSSDTIRRLICTSIAIIDRFFPAANAIIYGNEQVESAIEMANLNWDQESE